MGYPFKTRPILALMMGEVLALISLHSSHISFLCICIIAFFCCNICLIKIDFKNVCILFFTCVSAKVNFYSYSVDMP